MRKILVVDNENLICDACCNALGEMGLEVICVIEAQAIAIAKNNTFDLAVVNINTEAMTGVQTFEFLRKANPSLSGILIAGNISLDLMIDAMNKGFSRVCKKPLIAKQLVEAVNETLKINALREEVARMKILLPLYNLGQRFIAATSEHEIYEELADAVSREVKVPSVSVMMFDERSQTLKVVAYRGLRSSYIENLQIKPGDQIAGKVFQSESPIILNTSQQHLNHPYLELMNRKEISAAISFPIASKNKILGVLNVSETQNGMRFSEADVELLSIIAGQAMMALENFRSNREREEISRIRGLLEQYVSPEVSNLLIKSKEDLLNVGGVQQLTVLFADIRNFTLLVQYLEPVQLREFLNSFFDMFGSIVFSYKGMLDKFMGDAALVIFGAPVELANPNIAGVSAAYKIMIEFDKLRVIWEKKNNIFAKVGLGIGMSRGPMFLGNVGSSQRLDYTVIGPDVNIAQRLASETVSGQILITDRVQETLNGRFPVCSEKNMMLRGMEAEVTVYSLSVTEV
ncbi:MAG: adenylate/guanylate cyclase domain-containing protein [Desulforhopalus sp.]